MGAKTTADTPPTAADLGAGLTTAIAALKAIVHDVLSKIPGGAESEAQVNRAIDDALANIDLPGLLTAIKADVVGMLKAGHSTHSADAADLA